MCIFFNIINIYSAYNKNTRTQFNIENGYKIEIYSQNPNPASEPAPLLTGPGTSPLKTLNDPGTTLPVPMAHPPQHANDTQKHPSLPLECVVKSPDNLQHQLKQ